jgi:hypothetical protein
MSRVIFLADSPDPSTPTTVYGKGHQMDLADESACQLLNNQGKLAYMGALIRSPAPMTLQATSVSIVWAVDQPCTGMKVDYGTTSAYGTTQPATPASGSGNIVGNLAGLTTHTTYHYRISVTSGGVTTMTPDATFTTL